MSTEEETEHQGLLDKIKSFRDELNEREDFNEKEKEVLFEKFSDFVIASGGIKTNNSAIASTDLGNNAFAVQESTFASLVTKTKISQHTDIVLFSVYYLVLKEKYENVNIKDIRQEYKKAFLKPSANTSVYLRNLAKSGLIMASGKKEGLTAFTITKQGMQKVDEVMNNVQ